MSQSDELLNSVTNVSPVHTHTVTDDDSYFIIDPTTRVMQNASGLPIVLMQRDHQSERFTFELPRYVEGHDMMLCNRVKVHFDNIGTDYSEIRSFCELKDLRISPKDSSKTICTWLVERDSTMHAGVLSFLVQYACVEDGVEVYEWHTDIYSDVEIKPGRDNEELVVVEYSGVIEQWRQDIFGAGDSIISNIEAVSATQQAEIEAKGAETLESIPEDYTTVANMADQAMRTKAEGVILSETGNHILLDDSSDCNLLGLHLYGKTTQYKTTGVQLLDLRNYLDGKDSNTFHLEPDMSLVVTNKGSRPIVGFAHNITGTIPAGTYTFSMIEGILTYVQIGSEIDYSRPVRWGEKVTFEYDGTSYLRLLSADVVHTQTVRFKLMLNEGSVAKPYEPYSEEMSSPCSSFSQKLYSIENPEISIYGKNLIPEDKVPKTSSRYGITSDYEGNGIYHIYGTYNSDIDSSQYNTTDFTIPINRNSKYTLAVKLISGTVPVDYHPYVGLGSDTMSLRNWFSVKLDNTWTPGKVAYDTTRPKDYLVDAEEFVRFWIYTYNPGATSYTCDFRIQIWMVEGDYCDYVPSKVEQTTILEHTLRGVPVESGGNYTDSNGQEWSTDEIDFERGKYIKRINEVELTGGFLLNETTNEMWYQLSDADEAAHITDMSICLCSHYPGRSRQEVYDRAKEVGYIGIAVRDRFIRIIDNINFNADNDALNSWLLEESAGGNPVKFAYILNKPIETDLTAAELQAFKALKTNRTNTTLVNSENASMKVKYIADIERYIYNNVTIKQRKFDLNLPLANWDESDDGMYYFQTANIQARPSSKIDLHPTPQQLIGLISDGISMFAGNEDGTVTIYAIGGLPGSDLTIQATEEVVVYV